MSRLHTQPPVFVSIHDPSWQKQIWAEIVVWLEVNEADSEQPSVQFSRITVESFRALFQRLVMLADPTYEFPPPQVLQVAERWEIEFSNALSALSYPFQIDPSWILEPSNVDVWPFLLCICEWLLKEGKARVGLLVQGYPALSSRLVDAFPLEFGYGNGELYHEFLSFENYKNLELVDLIEM